MTAPACKMFCFVVTALIIMAGSPHVLSDETGNVDSKSIRLKLDSIARKRVEAQKQVALKKAAADVAAQRVADLEKQLHESQQRVVAANQSLESMMSVEAEMSQKAASLTEQLKRHQHVEQLLEVASVAKTKASAAADQHTALTKELTASQTQLFEQQQLQDKSVVALKVAQESLPKATEELSAARTAYDALAQNVDVARVAAAAARNLVKAKKALVQPERTRSQIALGTVVQISANITSLEQSLAVLREAAASTGLNADDVGPELAASIKSVQALQARAKELASVAEEKVADAERQVAKAVADLNAAEVALRDQQNKFAEQSRSHFKLQLRVADLQNADKLYEKQIADAKAQQEALAAKQKDLEVQIASSAVQVEELQDNYVEKQRVAEAAMEPLGRFVSFSRAVAPIFAKKCVACHNTRTASGRLNMDSFAALAKGGESGTAIEAHHAESSLLWSMIEDGSMPKDADPLSKSEIELIRKWIDVGAPLDAGVVVTAELFDVMPETAQPLPPETYRVPIPVTATAFNSDGSILASSGYHEILLWNTEDGSLVRRITNVAERVYDLEFSSDGTQLAVAAGTPGQLGEVKLFSTADGEHLKTLVRTKDAVFAVAISPDGSQIAAGGADRIVYAIAISTGKTILQIEDHADWVMDVNWSPDGKQLITSSRDKTAKVFDIASGASVITFSGHGDAVYSGAFLPDGKSVVSAGSDRQVRVWNPVDAKEIRRIGGFGSDIFRAAVTPEGHVFTACADRNAREHNLADGKEVRSFAGHKDWVYTLCYNPAKKLIATGSYDGEIRVWNSEDGSVATSFIAIPKAEDATVAAKEE